MQATVLLFGLLFVGIVLLGGAMKQMVTGRTIGSTAGRKEGAYSVVRFVEMPLLFTVLLIVRVVIGIAAIGSSIYFLSR